jgi:hypothetical protein
MCFYSVKFNVFENDSQVWIINIDKRPISENDYTFLPKKEWKKVKWVYTLVRRNSQITEFKLRFPFNFIYRHRPRQHDE